MFTNYDIHQIVEAVERKGALAGYEEIASIINDYGCDFYRDVAVGAESGTMMIPAGEVVEAMNLVARIANIRDKMKSSMAEAERYCNEIIDTIREEERDIATLYADIF